MPAGTYDITIEQGTDWSLTLTLSIGGERVNFGGYSARMQIRHRAASPTPLVSLTSDPASGITLGGDAGTITLELSASAAAAIVAGDHLYDLELIAPSTKVSRLIEGVCTVTAEITR